MLLLVGRASGDSASAAVMNAACKPMFDLDTLIIAQHRVLPHVHVNALISA
jgi:hypothetical protein